MDKTSAQLDNVYHRLSVSCDFSYTAVDECLSHMLPADAYYVSAGAIAYRDIKSMFQLRWNTENPFCPAVNLIFDPNLGKREWYINPIRYAKGPERNVDCWGSEGI